MIDNLLALNAEHRELDRKQLEWKVKYVWTSRARGYDDDDDDGFSGCLLSSG